MPRMMIRSVTIAGMLAIAFLTAIAAFAGSQLLVCFYTYRPHATDAAKTTQVRLATTQAMPHLDGASLKASIVEVTYPPGGESRPHTHPCPVIGYVVSGYYRSGVKGFEERVYGPGDTFYEAPNGLHLVSRNESSTESTTVPGVLPLRSGRAAQYWP